MTPQEILQRKANGITSLSEMIAEIRTHGYKPRTYKSYFGNHYLAVKDKKGNLIEANI
jgi:hypothetical protein